VALAAAAAVTRKIKLSSAVTVLSSADPVRTFQNFATLDLISGGRAEIMAGRGSFIESFPLFGYDLDDSDALFDEKLVVLRQLNLREKRPCQGGSGSSSGDGGLHPGPFQQSLPVGLAVGGLLASAARAGKLNLPMTLAMLGGMPEQFLPVVNLFR